MKNINELKEGKCIVIAEDTTGKIKRYEGSYNLKFEVVFFCIPNNYKILGYEQ